MEWLGVIRSSADVLIGYGNNDGKQSNNNRPHRPSRRFGGCASGSLSRGHRPF